MNQEFSGRGPGTRALENRGWEHWGGGGLGDGRGKDG